MLKCGCISNNPGASLGDMQVAMENTTGFNGNPVLEKEDFQAPAGTPYVGCLAYPSGTNTWVSAPLNASGLAGIARTGYTQFRIEFDGLDDDDDTVDDFIGFYPGDNKNAGNHPVLEVRYY
ncbi:MAG: hypothetical protein MUC65_01425, partial [Pontiellaceae bacterium]|nr:hypothetical protein [Pontiellaceae bacterium]